MTRRDGDIAGPDEEAKRSRRWRRRGGRSRREPDARRRLSGRVARFFHVEGSRKRGSDRGVVVGRLILDIASRSSIARALAPARPVGVRRLVQSFVRSFVAVEHQQRQRGHLRGSSSTNLAMRRAPQRLSSPSSSIPSPAGLFSPASCALPPAGRRERSRRPPARVQVLPDARRRETGPRRAVEAGLNPDQRFFSAGLAKERLSTVVSATKKEVRREGVRRRRRT